MTRTLLIDADIVAYRASASNERKYDWGDTGASKVSDLKAAKRAARDEVERLADELKATDFIICLSDDVQNFRKRIYPAYKGNRTGERPEHLYDIKDWLSETYQTRMIPWLEADDVMGILSTEPHTGDRIIVSQDKDMQTVPGLLFNPGKDKRVREIHPAFAQRFMLWQALTGDQTDGYPGCPGCGPKAADEILDHLKAWKADSWTITRGPRKGLTETKWELVDSDEDDWARVLSAYAKAGLGPKEAITQVNLARILKHSDYQENRVIPWVPAMLHSGAN